MYLQRLPGDPGLVRSGAQKMVETATLIRRCKDTMQRLVDGEAGTSRGLDKAIERAHVVIPRMSDAAQRYETAGNALLEFAGDQDLAIQAADEAIQRYQDAEEHLYKVQFGEVPEGEEDAHQSAMADARGDVESALAAYYRARDDYNDAAERADHRIEDAVDASSLNDSFWDDVGGFFSDIGDFLGDLAEVIGELVECLAALSVILLPLTLPPPIGLLLVLFKQGVDQPGQVPPELSDAAVEKYYTDPKYKAHVKEIFDLAANSYKDPGDDGYAPPKPWERLSEGALRVYGITMTDEDGFHADVYRNPETGEIVVAYRGTEPTKDTYNDVTEDIINGGGLPSSQGEQAVDLATQVVDAFGADNVEFTGHSLGGGLAASASVATGATATTFNAAGIGQGNYDNASAAYGDGANANNVTNFHTTNDPLTNVQNVTANTPPAGAQVTVSSNSSDWQFWGGHGTGQFKDFD